MGTLAVNWVKKWGKIYPSESVIGLMLQLMKGGGHAEPPPVLAIF